MLSEFLFAKEYCVAVKMGKSLCSGIGSFWYLSEKIRYPFLGDRTDVIFPTPLLNANKNPGCYICKQINKRKHKKTLKGREKAQKIT